MVGGLLTEDEVMVDMVMDLLRMIVAFSFVIIVIVPTTIPTYVKASMGASKPTSCKHVAIDISPSPIRNVIACV